MTPHEGPSERLPDPAPGCEPAPTGPSHPRPSSRTHRRARGLPWEVVRASARKPAPPNQPRVTDPTAPGWHRRWAVRYIPFSLHAVVAVWSTWRIRLVAYGARLESVLGASPRGFESPILRHHPRDPRDPGAFRFRPYRLLLTLLPRQAADWYLSPSTPRAPSATVSPCARHPLHSSHSPPHSSSHSASAPAMKTQ